MPRNRINYASQSLYVGPTPSTGFHFASGTYGPTGPYSAGFVTGAPVNSSDWLGISGNLISQLFRVQTTSERYAVTRRDVNQFGQLSTVDRVIIDAPTAGLDFTYLLANFNNELALGFTVNGQSTAISGIMTAISDEHNYFLKISNDGVDAIGDTTQNCSVMSLGNGFISSYSVSAAVGKFPEVAVKVDGLNLLFQNTSSGDSPAVYPSTATAVTGRYYILPTGVPSLSTGDFATSVLRPGDLTFTFNQHNTNTPYSLAGPLISNAKISSFNLGINLAREVIEQLGSPFPITRVLKFPIISTMTIDAVLGDLTTGNLANLLTCDTTYDIFVQILRPSDCAGSAKVPVCTYILRDARIDSQDYSSNIGSNTTVRLGFSTQLSGPTITTAGLFLSGIALNPIEF